MNAEIAVKHERLKGYMDEHGFSGLILASRMNFSWLTGGRLNYVNGAAEPGVAPLVVTRDKIYCVTNLIEKNRISQEELDGTGIDVIAHPWQLGSKRGEIYADLLADCRVGFDVGTLGLPKDAKSLPADFYRLRWSLVEEEIVRYKEVGKLSSIAMEKTIADIKPGMRETEIAGIASKHIWSESARPWVLLIAADDRIKQYRHPIPTDNKVKKNVMVVFCVEKYGLVCSLTRLVSFVAIDADLKKRHAAVAAVDAGINLHCKPGQTLGEMFDFICRQYASAGYDGEWQLHHQGGPTGYATRDCIATPNDPTQLVEHQAFAWNPSITGTKSEDTIITGENGPIVVTEAGSDWPMILCEYNGKMMKRPDILVVK